MLIYRLTNQLNSNETPEWEKLKSDELGQAVHPDRFRGYCLAREALRDCFNSVGLTLSVKDLKIFSHKEIEFYPEYTFSLSHNPHWGAAFLAKKHDLAAVGIDIESNLRVVKPAILERISHSDDISLRPIALWTVKEACFKALMNTGKFSRPVEFSELEIKAGNWIHSPSGIKGEWKHSTDQELSISLAWIKA